MRPIAGNRALCEAIPYPRPPGKRQELMAPRILGLITCTAALQAPLSRPPRAAPARAVKSALLSDYVLDLEKRCGAGEGDACDAIAQLDTFAKSLEQKRARRAKAAELLRAAGPPSVATAPATPAPASVEANFAPTPQPDSVEAALIRLFDSYDQTKSGAQPPSQHVRGGRPQRNILHARPPAA